MSVSAKMRPMAILGRGRRVRAAPWLLAGSTALITVAALVLAGLNASAGSVSAGRIGLYASLPPPSGCMRAPGA